jgi:hypothetical protein
VRRLSSHKRSEFHPSGVEALAESPPADDHLGLALRVLATAAGSALL